MKEAQKACDVSSDITPHHGKLWIRVYETFSFVAASMKKHLLEKIGEDNICKVGGVYMFH